MAINSTQQVCDSYSVVVLPEERNTESLSSSMEDCMLIKSHLSLDDQLNSHSQTYAMKMVENADPYSECIEKDVDIEKGNSETPKSNEESADNLKNEELQMLLMNHSMILPKLSTRDKIAAEKVVDAPRMRKYKRSASFNSRKVVLLFSVLSSLGTIILIYLTLRVKQIGDASIYSI